jgi:hypothetical protein
MIKYNYGGIEVEQKIADIMGVTLEELDRAHGFVREPSTSSGTPKSKPKGK